MKLIVGLGNPGEKYSNNRHNVGFMFVEYLFKTYPDIFTSPFKYDKYLKGKVSINDKIILLKPQTYMNLSGESVQAAMKNFKLKLEDIIVVHDDLDIPLRKFKIQKTIGPKVHNGLSSIEDYLHSVDFIRIRIGVENRDPQNRIPGEAFVLQDFTLEEKNDIEKIFENIYTRLNQEKII